MIVRQSSSSPLDYTLRVGTRAAGPTRATSDDGRRETYYQSQAILEEGFVPGIPMLPENLSTQYIASKMGDSAIQYVWACLTPFVASLDDMPLLTKQLRSDHQLSFVQNERGVPP